MGNGFPIPPTGGPPTGPAGGDLAGTYPDPTVDAIGGVAVLLTGGAAGDVLTQQAGGNFEPQALPAGGVVDAIIAGANITVDATDPTQPIVAAIGGAPAGAPVVRKFAFDLTTPNLDTGVDLYVPTIGDILLDAWIEIDVGFDGTTPKADLAQDWTASGLFVSATQRTALPVDFADNLFTGGGLLGGGAALLSLAEASATSGITTPIDPTNIGQRTVPAKFVSADPVQLVVSQNGTPTGGPVGGAAGSGVVYLVTVTPV